MPVKTNNDPLLAPTPGQGWWLHRWAGTRILAGITNRETSTAQLLSRSTRPLMTIAAEQVHGASLAVIERSCEMASIIPGCDALITSVPGIALLIRTADCLPIFFADPIRGVVGLAHAGWRGLAAQLPARMVAAFQHLYHTSANQVAVAIGPAIHTCCYDVGQEFAARFGSFVEEGGGRQTCNLIGVATQQLQQAGVRRAHIVETGHCTACEPAQWFSLRREGPATGRMTSLIAIRP